MRFLSDNLRVSHLHAAGTISRCQQTLPGNSVWLLGVLTLVLWAFASHTAAARQPNESEVPEDLNTCALCHGTPELWEGEKKRLYISKELVAGDVHLQKGVKCAGCHGGNPQSFDVPEAHARQVEAGRSDVKPFRYPLGEISKVCADCHAEQSQAMAGDAHAGQVVEDAEGNVIRIDCTTCHGKTIHGMVPIGNPKSPVFRAEQVELCGGCHLLEQQQYNESVHGHGLHRSGLLVTAVCADCHGAHGVFPASDPRSTLHVTRVSSTCAKCHRFIVERLRKSVHGTGNGPGGPSEKPAPGGEIKRKPSCTDCHQGHDLPHPKSAAFRLRLPSRCGNCHVEYSHEYGMSLHGALTDLGYGPGAKCSDCHGAHDIRPISDPGSRLAPGSNRLATCRKCHPHAVANFCDFQPHADPHNAQRSPLLFAVRLAMEILIFGVFAFFGVHSLLWFLRSLVHVIRHGRPRRLVPGSAAYVRFAPLHRIVHVVVIVSFLGLALTGLPLRYSTQAWARTISNALGGFQSTSFWHHLFGVVTISYFVFHLLWLAKKLIAARRREHTPWTTLIFGPDSPVPNLRDFVDMVRMFRWFLGLGPKPVFERWTYWEKFDYWAVFWGVGIIGSSGLILWYPNLFSRFLPGIVLNIAKIIHSEEALLATSFIFAIHFFGTHLRPEKFPIDMAVLAGLVSEEEMEEERADFLQRMRREGKLEELKTTVPSRGTLTAIALGGFVALAVGWALLAGIVVAVFAAV